MSEISVLPATLDDLPQLSEVLVQNFYSTTPFAGVIEPDYKSYIGVSAKIIMDEMFIVAKDEQGAIVGAIAGMLSPFMFNQNYNVAVELLWYVLPGYRGGLGQSLLAALEQKCKEKNCVFLTMAQFNNSHSTKLEATLLSKGYKLTEFAYVKNLKEN